MGPKGCRFTKTITFPACSEIRHCSSIFSSHKCLQCYRSIDFCQPPQKRWSSSHHLTTQNNTKHLPYVESPSLAGTLSSTRRSGSHVEKELERRSIIGRQQYPLYAICSREGYKQIHKHDHLDKYLNNNTPPYLRKTNNNTYHCASVQHRRSYVVCGIHSGYTCYVTNLLNSWRLKHVYLSRRRNHSHIGVPLSHWGIN